MGVPQFVGSYHASGTDQREESADGGNQGNVELAHSLDMGVFCISPNDKGGMLYKPSKVEICWLLLSSTLCLLVLIVVV